MLIERYPQRIVIGISRTENLGDIADGARRIGSGTLRGQHRAAKRKRGERTRVVVETVGHERLIKVAGHLQVRGLHADVRNLQPQ